MKITIIKEDWYSGIDYTDDCGCLLSRAVKRQTGERAFVVPGTVEIKHSRTSMDFRELHYDREKYEADLQAAHANPSKLPLEIELEEKERKGNL